MRRPHDYRPHSWMRHMASVPKGYLKYNVMNLLNKKPMSGSELMSTIEEQTEGHWKPSPGSIYPLLAWLQDKGYTKMEDSQEQGIKRYSLTPEGKAFLEELVERKKEIQNKFGGFRHHFMAPWMNSYPENAKELFDAGKDFMKANWRLFDELRKKHTKEAINKAKEVIVQATDKINQITKELEKDE
jgi:DNA-binding PadR family transcriptional regulator